MKLRYLIVIEKTENGYSAWSPDLQGCVATGKTRERVKDEMRGAIQFHVDGMSADGLEVPTPRTDATYVEVST